MNTLTITINNREVGCSEGETVLDVAHREGIYVPTLCFDERLSPVGACRVCLVGVKGRTGPVAACTTLVREAMVVDTHDPLAQRVARAVVELVLSDYPAEALAREGDRNELRKVARHFGLDTSRFAPEPRSGGRDDRHPYVKMNLDECIVCGRCVRACDEVQGSFALGFARRGFETNIVAGVGSALTESTCVSCGACVSACPTGALDEAPFRDNETLDRVVTTTCAYCGVGCRLEANVRGGKVVSIDPALDGPSNKGHTCLKGRFAHSFASSTDRLTRPLIRDGGGLREASWNEALSLVGQRLREIRDKHGPDAIGGISSSRCTNEENYAMQKLMRAAIGTHNIDNCARVCHSPSSAGLIASLGFSGGTNSFNDIEKARAIFLTGANPTEAHPVVGARIKQAALAGARLIVVDPRRIELARYAEVFLQLRPGTNLAVFNGLAHVIAEENLTDRGFLAARAEGVETYLEFIKKYTPELVEEISGVRASELRRAARVYATSAPAGIFYGLGVTEQSQGTPGVQCLINLAILTANLGRDGAGVNPLRGQNNVQGGSDAGALPNVLAMYQPVTDEAVRARFEKRWGTAMKPTRGLMIPEMFEAATRGELKAMYVFGEDIAQTDPNTQHVHQALRALDFLVCQDIFLSETAKFADVVLPGSAFLEKTGTFTNAERRIQMVHKAVDPPLEARDDLSVIVSVASALGYDMQFATPAEAMDEMAELAPPLAGVSHSALGRQGLQWPVPHKGHPGTRVLYREEFATKSGRARLRAVDWEATGEVIDPEFPLVLLTGRQLAHYNAGTMTRRTGNLELHPGDMAEVHPEDAAELGLIEGDEVEVASRRGALTAFAHVSTRVAPGNVFLSFHFPEVLTNLLTSERSDAVTRCPEYKVTAVRVRKVADGAGRAPRWLSGMHPGGELKRHGDQ